MLVTLRDKITIRYYKGTVLREIYKASVDEGSILEGYQKSALKVTIRIL